MIGTLMLVGGLNSGNVFIWCIGLILLLLSITFGFVMLGVLVEVKEETEIFQITNITRGNYNITAEYDNVKTVTSTDARYYNAEDTNLEIVIIRKLNSYGFCPNNPKINFQIKKGE